MILCAQTDLYTLVLNYLMYIATVLTRISRLLEMQSNHGQCCLADHFTHKVLFQILKAILTILLFLMYTTTVLTRIRRLPEEQSDQGQCC